MNRRNFFKSLLGAAALIALPSWLRRPHPDDFTIEFQEYKDPVVESRKYVRNYFRMPLDIDNIEPYEIPFRRDGEWHHYGFTRQSGKITWYVDGERV